MAAFAQLAVVGRGSNTCVYVIAIFTMCESSEQRICSNFVLKSENPQWKRINYCSKHMVKMQWVVHKCLTGSVDLNRVEPPLKATPARGDRFFFFKFYFILIVSYTTSALPTGKQLTRNSTWRSCDVCGNQFAENDRKMAGWRLDPAPRQCARTHFTFCAAVFGQTRHRSVAAAAILTRSRTM